MHAYAHLHMRIQRKRLRRFNAPVRKQAIDKCHHMRRIPRSPRFASCRQRVPRDFPGLMLGHCSVFLLGQRTPRGSSINQIIESSGYVQQKLEAIPYTSLRTTSKGERRKAPLASRAMSLPRFQTLDLWSKPGAVKDHRRVAGCHIADLNLGYCKLELGDEGMGSLLLGQTG
jgi:hypothetical protein